MVQDGYIETQWFDSSTGQPSRQRPLGTRFVRVRAWADPGRPGFTLLSAETVYRPLADPSLPSRELEREVPKDHPVAAKVRTALQSLVKKYGGPPTVEPTKDRGEQGAGNGEQDNAGQDTGDQESDSE